LAATDEDLFSVVGDVANSTDVEACVARIERELGLIEKPGMVRRRYGRIVNVASIAGKEGTPATGLGPRHALQCSAPGRSTTTARISALTAVSRSTVRLSAPSPR
jgi:hypothetical protein